MPSVEGARTPVNSLSMAPGRSRSLSSIESAPATIPAISALTLVTKFGEPTVNRSVSSRERPACSASASPAHDTRFPPSNTASITAGS